MEKKQKKKGKKRNTTINMHLTHDRIILKTRQAKQNTITVEKEYKRRRIDHHHTIL